MTKISNQRAYIPDEEINGLDYLPGTDFDQALKTVNFRVQDLGTHYNQVNGVRNFDYNFYQHVGPTAKPVDGYFYSNSNEQDPNNITHFIFSKKTARLKDTTNFFESIATENPFDLIIAQKVDINTIFFFRIDSIETFSSYYKLNVSEVFFPNGKELSYTLSNAVFNLKSEGISIHNQLNGLNDGDYIHLTQAEKDRLDNLPESVPTKTSELINDGSDETSTYVEADELSLVAFSNNYNDLDNVPLIPVVSTLIKEEFIFSGSQTFTLANNYAQVYSVEVQGQGALSTSQYTLVPLNQVTINDTLDTGDYVVIMYSDASAGVVPYYTQAQVDVFLALKENKLKPPTKINSNYTILSTDEIIICETNSFNVTLPTAVTNNGRKITVTSLSTGIITLVPFGAETIQGETTQLIYENETFDLFSDGINWIVI